MRERDQKETPRIIGDLNVNLKPSEFTVEGIAQKIGISKTILYEWVITDTEFSDTLERLLKVQKDDPFKTGTGEDSQVNAMMVALLLMETRDRHYKPDKV